MKLVSFFLPSPMGAQIRTGALDAAGGIVDLAGAFRGVAARRGAHSRGCRARQRGAVAGRHGGADRRRRTLARRRAPGAAMGGGRRAGCRIECRAGCAGVSVSGGGTSFPAAGAPAAAAAGLHGVRDAPAQHLPEAGARDPARVVQDSGVLQGQPRQPRRPRRRHSDPLVRHGARYRVRAGDGHRAGRHQHPAGAARSTTSSAT